MSLILQIFLAITAPTAIYLLGHGYHKSACVLGLASQVGFFLLFGLARQWIMFIVCTIYILVWIGNLWKLKDVSAVKK